MFKKIIIILCCIGFFLGGIALIDYFADSVDIYGLVMNIFNRTEKSDYTNKNLESFKPIVVKRNLKAAKESPEEVAQVKILYENTYMLVPVYTKDIRNTFSDTVFATDGSFYMVASKNKENHKKVEEVEVVVHNLGRGEPKVVEVRMLKSDIVLYIQCYTPEALAFYTSTGIQQFYYHTTAYDFTKTNDEIATSTSINEELYLDNEEMFLDEAYIHIVNNFRMDYEGYSDFRDYEGMVFNYYRAVGFLETRMKVEYAKLIEMEYTPIEVGVYEGISYIKFIELTLLGSPVTNNSCLIYHVIE